MSLRLVGFIGILFSASLSLFLQAEPRVTQEYAVSHVDSIEVRGVGTLVLTQGNSDSLKVVGEPDNLASIKVDLTNNHLTISSDNKAQGWRGLFSDRQSNVEYQLQVKNLHQLRLSGAVNARLGEIVAKELHVNLSGAVNITSARLKMDDLRIDASGAVNFDVDSIQATELSAEFSGAGHFIIKNESRAEIVSIHSSGAAEVDAKRLSGAKVLVDASGAAKISVHAERELDAHASGASNIEYSGNAQIKQETSGVSHIRKL